MFAVFWYSIDRIILTWFLTAASQTRNIDNENKVESNISYWDRAVDENPSIAIN